MSYIDIYEHIHDNVPREKLNECLTRVRFLIVDQLEGSKGFNPLITPEHPAVKAVIDEYRKKD